MVQKRKTKRNNKKQKMANNIHGGFLNDIANLALIPGLATYGAYKIQKNLKKKKGGTKKRKEMQKGGFIRAPSTQHFYSNCNQNTTINNDNTLSYEPGS